MTTAALRNPANWLQLIRFTVVGGSGYAVNLAVFATLTGVGTGHRSAAFGAFLVAVSNNFMWNRRWTFDAREGHAGWQAGRFLTVSVLAFLAALGVLELLVSGLEVQEILAQAIAIVSVTPFSFLGNRLWSFRG